MAFRMTARRLTAVSPTPVSVSPTHERPGLDSLAVYRSIEQDTAA